MARPGRELLHLTAPVAIAPQDNDTDTVVVKGFASVEKASSDRSGDVVPPDEFDIDKFMVAPTLLVNHKFWLDDHGNGIAAGRPTAMHAVKIADIESESDWGVIDLKTKEQVNTFPKAQIPRLKSGDRGLFVVADVTVDDVAKMVASGELSTFSWRGLVTVAYRVNDTGRTERVLTDIDLYEVSLTHIPDQTSAQAVIVKSVDGVDRKLPLNVYCVRLEKSKYESEDLAKAYFRTHDLQCDSVKDENGSFYGFQREQNEFDANRLVAVKMADGVHVIAGPLKPEAESFAWVTQSLASEETEKLAALNTTDTQEGETMAENEVQTTDEKEEILKEAEALESFGDSLAEKTAEGVASALAPAFETLAETLKSVGSGMEMLVEKAAGAGAGAGAGSDEDEEEDGEKKPPFAKKSAKKAAAQDEEEEEEKAAVKKAAKNEDEKTEKQEVGKTADLDTVMGVLNSLAQNLQKTQTQVVEVAKTAEGLSKATPSDVGRDERIAVEKSAERDPNSVFDSTFPFIGNIS